MFFLCCYIDKVRDKAGSVTQKGEDASQKAEDTKARVKVILEDLPKQIDKTGPLTLDSINTKRDISTARTQGNQVCSNVRVVNFFLRWQKRY